jgi:bifunctional DNA-binding transcriptional regulator/antitoxin component of YhaV-PrlF toxin-antitoxin module
LVSHRPEPTGRGRRGGNFQWWVARRKLGKHWAVLKVNERYRVVLDKEVREILKIAPGDKVLVIPYSEEVLITSLKGKRFKISLAASGSRKNATKPPSTYSRIISQCPVLEIVVFFGAADPEDPNHERSTFTPPNLSQPLLPRILRALRV